MPAKYPGRAKTRRSGSVNKAAALYVLIASCIAAVTAELGTPFGIPLYNYEHNMLPYNTKAFVTYVGPANVEGP